jgi:DNA-binding GntR family transcriptional regulator
MYAATHTTGVEGMDSHKLTTKSLEERVYEALRDSIVAGSFRPGDALVEAQLSERFGVSKTPVREALIRLKRDGLVDASMHRVNRVATPSAERIRQAFEVRSWLESALTARAAEAPSAALLRELKASIDQARAALAADDTDGYVQAVRRFSDVIVSAGGNDYAEEVLERLRNVLTLIAHISRETAGRRERSIAEHEAIYNAIRRKDPAKAAEATRSHLESIKQDSLQALKLLQAAG